MSLQGLRFRAEESAAERIQARDAAAARDVAYGAYAAASRHTASHPGREQWACAPGCSICCRLFVSISPPEALGLAEHLRGIPDEGERTRLFAAVAAGADAHQGRSIGEVNRAGRPCALLDAEGKCGVYEHRPLRCRAHTSRSAEACETAQAKGDAAPVAQTDEWHSLSLDAIQTGMRRSLERAGLQSGLYELHGALHRALQDPDAARRWAEGEAVFDGCTPGM